MLGGGAGPGWDRTVAAIYDMPIIRARFNQALRASLDYEPEASAAGEVERLFRIRVEAFDWNCPQFITPRYSEAELEERERPLRQRIADLEADLHRVRAPSGDGEAAAGG